MYAITSERLYTKAKISNRINEALHARGIAEHGRGAELARLCGISPQAAAKWLSGQAMPSIANLMRIAFGYRIELKWLLTGQGNMLYDADLQDVIDNWHQSDEMGRRIIKTVSAQTRNDHVSN